MVSCDHSIRANFQCIAEDRRHPQFFHQGAGKLGEGIADDDHLGTAAEFIEKETPQHAVFISWTQHINPVCALAGRDIVCGPDLWLYYHGLNTWERQMDIREFYRDPAGNRKMLEDYNISYIFVGSYERANLTIDEDALDREFDRVFESSNGEITIWWVNHDE